MRESAGVRVLTRGGTDTPHPRSFRARPHINENATGPARRRAASPGGHKARPAASYQRVGIGRPTWNAPHLIARTRPSHYLGFSHANLLIGLQVRHSSGAPTPDGCCSREHDDGRGVCTEMQGGVVVCQICGFSKDRNSSIPAIRPNVSALTGRQH